MSAKLGASDVRTAIRVALFLAELAILVFLVIGLDVNEIVRLTALIGWNLAVILLVYGGCPSS